MAEIQKAQSFPASAERCLTGLVRIWPYLAIRVRSSNPAEGTAEGSWRPGAGAVFIFRAECKKTGEETCEVSLRHDLQWTSIWSRPTVPNEKVGSKLNEKTLEQMDRIFSTLGQFLEEEAKFPEGAAAVSLNLDHVAWAIGAIVSVGIRLLIVYFRLILAASSSEVGGSAFLRVAGLAGVLVGAMIAGLVKRRNPAWGSAFFEGLIVAIVNIGFSVLVYSSAFSMGYIDWIVYGVVGIAVASLASIRLPVKKAD
ncbi:MAG: hypothetical protein ABSB41_04575 [Anaerolineales bacterium]